LSSPSPRIEVTVADVVPVNELVTRFEFERPDGRPLPPFSGGAHVVVEMPDGGSVRRNPYSLMSSPLDTRRYAISVRRDDQGRGGSLFLHTRVKPGMALAVSHPVNLFPLDLRAGKHLMIAGGIGITPFVAQIAQLAETGGHFELHYSCRSEALASYADLLKARHGSRIHLYCDDRSEQIALERLLGTQPPGTHLYVCGPQGMIRWVRGTAEAHGWPKQHVHWEHFSAPPPGKPFDVTLALSGKTIRVGESQSLLEAIEAAGANPPYLCRGGACGQCETRVLAAEGTFIHNDHWLTDEDRREGRKIMPCVSRFEGPTLVLER
jgi:dimethylamine monooxygenase subunit B